MGRLSALGLFLLLGACAGHSQGLACAKKDVSPDGTSSTPPEPPSAAVEADTAPPAKPEEKLTWVEAVRLERWADAARIIDALPDPDQKKADVRYVRARAAMMLDDHGRAVKLLDGLGKELPVLQVEIARDRAAAQLEAGPYDAAARYFAARADSDSLTKAASAFERAADLPKAWASANQSVRVASKSKRKNARELEAAARAVRARIAEKRGKTHLAVTDLRWIATMAPTSAWAAEADERLEKLAPKLRLTKSDRYERAMSFAREGKVEENSRELALLSSAPGQAISKGDLAHARAWALYMSRSDYQLAAELLEKAIELGTKFQIKDLFYAARARSRAHQDALAIEMYEKLAKKYPRSAFAEQARYLVARLHYIGGNWDKAVRAYEDYLARHKSKGRYVKPSRHSLAVSSLAGKKYKRAVRLFDELAAGADSRHAARMRHLRGVAKLGAGDQAGALADFNQVIRDRPLSYPALASAARLRAAGSPVPPLIEPGATVRAPKRLDVKLAPRVQLFVRVGLDADAEAEIRAHEATLKKSYGDRGNEALCEAYGKLSRAARRYRVGQRAVRWTALSKAPSNATRWTWDCLYPRPYESVVREMGKENRLEPELIYAIIRQESAFHPTAVSPAKAVGLMQLIPPTARTVAKELDVDYDPLLLRSPVYNIRFGSYYLRKVLDTFGGRVELGAAAYNAGPGAVSRWLESGEGLQADVWVARIPYEETRNYVSRVVGNHARYAFLSGGEKAVPVIELDLPKGLRAGPNAY